MLTRCMEPFFGAWSDLTSLSANRPLYYELMFYTGHRILQTSITCLIGSLVFVEINVKLVQLIADRILCLFWWKAAWSESNDVAVTTTTVGAIGITFCMYLITDTGKGLGLS